MNEWLNARLKSAVTLVVLVLLVVGGVFWGAHALTAPFPSRAKAPLCTPHQVAKGTRIFPAQVLVNVYNASTQSGLATNVMSMFADRGFGTGVTGNQAGAKVKVAAVWTTSPSSPDVQLVLKQLGKGAVIQKKAPLGPGVTVLIGSGFSKLQRSSGTVKAAATTEICSPPVS